MQADEGYQNERLDHLGIVAGVCQEIGLVKWLDQQAGERRNLVSIGTATMAMVLNGLGFSNRQLYLVPQFFANKPVEHLLGEGISADMLHDDCLGRTLDWIAEHDPTMLFAGIAQQARSRFGFSTKQIHVDTTSFSVSGAYEADPEAGEPACIAITYGYSRDHRADLQQWMLGLVTTQDGDIPLFMRPLDGNSSDKVSISAIVGQVVEQLRASQQSEQEAFVVFDSGGYSQANMKAYNEAQIHWCSRVPETSTEAKAALDQQPDQWQEFSDQSGHFVRLELTLPQGKERWLMIRTQKNLEAAQKTLEKKANKDREVWEKKLWHLGTERFACQSDAQAAWEKAIKKLPVWLHASMGMESEPYYGKAGRPSADVQPMRIDWKMVANCQIDQQALERAADRQARFLLATNELSTDTLSDEELLAVYKGQGSAERGFRFLKDPLFLVVCQSEIDG